MGEQEEFIEAPALSCRGPALDRRALAVGACSLPTLGTFVVSFWHLFMKPSRIDGCRLTGIWGQL